MAAKLLQLWRYPVKSLKGESLSLLKVEPHGISGDRIYAFKDRTKSGSFPWYTIRQAPQMVQYSPQLDNAGGLSKIVGPNGEKYDAESPHFIDALKKVWGGDFELVHNSKNILDDGPVSLLSRQRVESLQAQISKKVDFMRFRPNLYVDFCDINVFEEDLVGRELRLGEVVLKVESPDPRCVVINVDPLSAQKDSDILKSVAKNFSGSFGVYLSVVKPGVISIDDSLEVL